MENTAKTSTDLAITEKKTHKPGGCVGIFFQLFDWKRRLAQNKLFPKKFLPPGRAKQCSKQFKAIEKLPSSKLQLIADENSGSFVNRKKDSTRAGVNLVKEHGMRAPTLVARLMGLDSMPLVNRDKPKKASVSESCKKGSEREDRNFEKGSLKIDLRPPKLRKTDYSEKRVVTRFGPEALPFKSVLSQSRKNHHQPKLPSPINSPRFSSGRSVKRTSRLIDAASRILEPGLLATNRAKCAIAYSNSRTHASSGGLPTERNVVLPLDEHNAANSFVGTTSCESYDSFLGVGRVKQNTDQKPFIYRSLDLNSGNSLPPEMARSKTMPSRDFIFENNGQNSINVSFVSEPAVGRLHLDRQYRCPSASSHPRKLMKHGSSSFPFNYGNQPQNQSSPGPKNFSARSEISNLHSGRVSLSANVPCGAKDSNAFHRGMCSRSRATVPTELENSKFYLEKTAMNRREEPRPQLRTSARKRRMIGASGFADSQIVVDLNNSKQRNLDYDKLIDRRLGLDPCSTNRSCVEIKLNGREEAKGVYGKNIDVVSFAFGSPMRPTDQISAAMEGEIMDNRRRVSFQKQYGLREDAIGALLEQKLIELSSGEDDELTAGASAKRSAAIILQELIAASTDDFPRSQDCSIAKLNVDFNADAETEISMRMSKDGNHFSPGSVLEASFSSSSMDDGSGTNTRSRLPADIMDYTTERLHPLEADLFDPVTNEIGSRRLNEIIEDVSLIIKTIGLSGVRLTGSKLSHAKEVLLFAEQMFGNDARHFVDETITGLLASPLFIDGNETIAARKEGNKQRGFVFDCLIEFMDSKCSRFYNLEFNTWTRLVSCLHGRTMIEDFGDEVMEWTSFLEMCLDEMIELEMSRSTGKWTDFSCEGFETGADIEQGILQLLVEEILVDMRIHPLKQVLKRMC